MEDLVKVVNKLQDAFAQAKITCPFDLPQIVVVGEQSAGKSSVLEKFVGRDFLPRGSGIVTRRPLVLQLVNQDGQEYGVFSHNTSRKYTNFDDIRKEIELETDRVTGTNKNISPLPINLRIFSPNGMLCVISVLTLTLVDLPGVTNIAVGDQPADIGAQIRDMVMQVISNPNSLILAVIPAVIDVANSEALKLAQEVDPDRIRTIGVITKIDMMSEGTDCMDILSNKFYPLARGFIGVVNRSQKDIVQNKDLGAAQSDEMMFFKKHPAYRNLEDRVGTLFLQKTLSEQLAVHIMHNLPELKANIMEQLAIVRAQFDENPALQLESCSTKSSAQMVVFMLLQDLIEYMNDQLGFSTDNVYVEKLSQGSEISWTLMSRFPLEIEKVRPIPTNLKREIYIAIANMSGVRGDGFNSKAAFFAVMKSQIPFIKSPCMIVLDAVLDQMRDLFYAAAEKIVFDI
ncbi:Dynamin-2 [Thelohanellus kitauei]|uniref:dynamin GTPase n=1 Tax=Thelohanellus kitauei TaxID=669202 RepID=A0A0C2J7S6_THEKT|nr:Dynamin-2 [Thelohanellus kitauei]